MNKISFATVILLTFFSSFNCSKDSKSFFDIVSEGTPEEVQKAIQAGANVNERDSDGWTPLMYAARYNQNPEVIDILLKSGADGKLKDKEGKTAFDYAKDNEKINSPRRIKGTTAYWELNDAQYTIQVTIREIFFRTLIEREYETKTLKNLRTAG